MFAIRFANDFLSEKSSFMAYPTFHTVQNDFDESCAVDFQDLFVNLAEGKIYSQGAKGRQI